MLLRKVSSYCIFEFIVSDLNTKDKLIVIVFKSRPETFRWFCSQRRRRFIHINFVILIRMDPKYLVMFSSSIAFAVSN